MKIAAMQTGSLAGELLEAIGSGQKTAPAAEGADFTAVLEEAGQALQAPAAKEASPAVAEILSKATAEARLAGETILPQVEAQPVFPQPTRSLPTTPAETVTMTTTTQPVEELMAEVAAPEVIVPRDAAVIEHPQHPETRGATNRQHPEALSREEEIIPREVKTGKEARVTFPSHGEGKREARVEKDSDERQETPVAAEEALVAQPVPVVALAAAAQVQVTEAVPTQPTQPTEVNSTPVEAAAIVNTVPAEAVPAAQLRDVYPQQAVRQESMPKVEAPKSEAAKAEVVKPEAVRAEVVKADGSRAEVVKPEAVRAEVVKPDVAKVESPRPEVAKAEVVRTEAARSEVVRPEPVKAEAVQAEAVRAEEAKPEMVKAEAVKPEAVKAEVVKTEGLRAEVVKPEAVRAEVVKPEAVKAEVVKPETAKPETAKAEATRPEATAASRFEVTQGVAGYREHSFGAILRKAPAAEVPVAAAPVAEETVVANTPVENPADGVKMPASANEKQEAVVVKAPEVKADQAVKLAAEKPEVGTTVAVKPGVTSTEVAKQNVPENAASAQAPEEVALNPAEAVRDPHRLVAARQQSPRQEQVEEPQTAGAPKASTAIGEARPVVEVAVRQKGQPEPGGEKQFSEGGSNKHFEGLQQAFDVNRPQFQVAEPVKQEMSAEGKTALHENILNQVRDHVEANPAEGSREVTLRLNPEELGELTISVKMDGRNVKVDVVAENATVKQALLENVDRLKETFSRQNMTMEQFDVSTGNGGRFQQQAHREQQQAAQRPAWLGTTSSPANFAEADRQKVAAYYKPRENSLIDVRF